MNLSDQAAIERREYQRKWRAANKEKVREINRRYWEKRAKKKMQQTEENDGRETDVHN